MEATQDWGIASLEPDAGLSLEHEVPVRILVEPLNIQSDRGIRRGGNGADFADHCAPWQTLS